MGRKLNHKEVGEYGEKKAKEYLVKKGYEIIDKNYRLRIGEIDIIARDNKTLVFVEVKTRRSDFYGSPSAAVDYRKQQKIRQLARYYLQKENNTYCNIRFDVIGIYINNKKGKLKHYINAF